MPGFNLLHLLGLPDSDKEVLQALTGNPAATTLQLALNAEEMALCAKYGITPTKAGLVTWIEGLADAGIAASATIPSGDKAALIAIVNYVGSKV